MKKLILLCAIFLITGMTLNTFGQVLSGDYYIPQGANPQGYSSLALAIADLNTNGCSGTVYFYIDGDLAETGANLLISRNDLTGTNNLIIKPASGKTPTVTISGCTSTAGATAYAGLTLSGSSYITIDGSNTVDGTSKDLTVKMNDATNGRNVIQLYGNSDNILIKNLNITYQAPMSTSTSTRGIYLNGQATGATDNFTVQNCIIGDATNTPYYALGLTGSSGSAIYCTNLNIKNNILFGRIRPIYVYYVGTTGTTCEISGNSIYTYGGINGTTTYTIMGNNWGGTLNIFNNVLPTMTTNNSVTSGVFGISFLAGGTGATCNIYNNFIGGDLSFTGTGIPTVISLMYLQDNATYNVYYNSFNYPSLTNNTERSCIHISGASAQVSLKNNIFINSTDAANAYCIWKSNGTLTSNYNNLYVSGANANVGYVTATPRKTLSDWQGAGFGYDANSVSKSAIFVNTTDLHISGASIGDNDLSGTPIATVTTDIDGHARHALFPYMGADENTGSLLRLVSPRPVPMTSSVSNADAFSANGLLGTNPTSFYVHWDATYLYLGWDGGRTNYSSDLYYAAIDTDPLGTNGTANAIEGVSFVTGGPKPDYYVVYENNSSFYGATADLGNAFEIYGVNEGNWVWISRTDGNDNVSSRVVFSDGPGQVRLRVPWATLNFVPGASAKLGIVMWNNNSSGNYLWGVVPVSVPTEGATPVTLTKFFLFPSTGNDVNPSTDKSESVFPVELSMFKARFVGKNVELNWTTATEQNSNKFVIERKSSDVWVSLAEVNASGNSNSPKEYSFSDKNLADGKYSYRLKMIDNDGTFEYSPVVEVEVEVPNTFALSQNYPNPFNPVTQIQYQLPVNSQVKLMIFSITGELVTTLVDENQPAGNYTVPFDASALASGTYIYRLVAGDFVSTKKMVVLK